MKEQKPSIDLYKALVESLHGVMTPTGLQNTMYRLLETGPLYYSEIRRQLVGQGYQGHEIYSGAELLIVWRRIRFNAEGALELVPKP